MDVNLQKAVPGSGRRCTGGFGILRRARCASGFCGTVWWCAPGGAAGVGGGGGGGGVASSTASCKSPAPGDRELTHMMEGEHKRGVLIVYWALELRIKVNKKKENFNSSRYRRPRMPPSTHSTSLVSSRFFLQQGLAEKRQPYGQQRKTHPLCLLRLTAGPSPNHLTRLRHPHLNHRL